MTEAERNAMQVLASFSKMKPIPSLQSEKFETVPQESGNAAIFSSFLHLFQN